MVSSSSLKKENAERLQNLNKSPGGYAKPLHKYKFYLDVKNPTTSKKLENKIRELGGIPELFLIKEVTHVITDREEWCSSKGGGSNPKTPQAIAHDVSPKAKTGRIRPKTRADAMLEKARKSTTNNFNAKDPLDDAKLWGITIWTVDKAISCLDRVTASFANKKKDLKLFQLKTPYIKFEAFDRQTRPIFKEIHSWPIINLCGSSWDPGLLCRSPDERNMTRKTRSHQPRLDTPLQPGYCEVCRVDYPRLDKHLESEKHLSFVSDSANFLELDALINDGTNIEAFLKLNNVSLDAKNLELEEIYTPPITRNKMPRTRTSSLCDKLKQTPLTPTGNDLGHRLRPRISNPPTSYVGTTAFDDSQPLKHEGARESRELRSNARQSNVKTAGQGESETTWDSGRPKRTCITRKRTSADERLVVDNKSYYKVEVLPTKLRSSAPNNKEQEIATKRVQTPILEPNEVDKGLIVKFRRMRTSELKQLNNEAENFLFPNKDDSSSEEDVDADNPNTTASTAGGDSTLLLSSEDEKPLSKLKNELEEECSMDSTFSDASNARRRKRRTHAEAFILDNEKYYKFETPGSRLRYHGSFMPQMPVVKSAKNNGEHLVKAEPKIPGAKVLERKAPVPKVPERKLPESTKVPERKVPESTKVPERKVQEPKKEAGGKSEKPKLSLDDFTFSFESVPKSEPWYQTFQRQDEGREYYTCFSDSGFWKPFLLPYEMPPLPPLDPTICIAAYEDVKKQILETKSATNSVTSCSTPDPSCTSGPDLQEENSETSEDSNKGDGEEEEEAKKSDEPNQRVRKRRKGIILPTKNPRKSPRQHASTLAILSSLIQQRKKRELKSRNSEDDASKDALPSISEEINSVEERLGTDYATMAKNLETMLGDNLGIEEIEITIPLNETCNINVSYNSDAIQVLEDYETQKANELIKTSLFPTSTALTCLPGRKSAKKKKKKNRTGWPSRSRRIVLKREFKEEPIDESTVDSLNVSDDNEDICDEKIAKTDFHSDASSINNKNCELPRSNVHKNDIVKKNDQSSIAAIVNSDLNSVQNDKEHKNCSDKEDRVNRTDNSSSIENCTDNCNMKAEKCVDLEKWENAEKVLSAKLTNTEALNSEMQFQPFVRVQKMDSVTAKHGNRRLRSSSSPRRTNVKRPRRMPASPKSPRILRKPRGRWYRER